MPSSSRRPPYSSLAIALLALVLAVSRSYELLHFVLVPHTTCAEHGETLHGGAEHGEPGHAHDRHDRGHHPEHDGPTLAEAPAPEEHDHCVFTEPGVRTKAGVTPPAGGSVLRIAESSDALLSPSPRSGGISILDLAPKNSPPRA